MGVDDGRLQQGMRLDGQEVLCSFVQHSSSISNEPKEYFTKALPTYPLHHVANARRVKPLQPTAVVAGILAQRCSGWYSLLEGEEKLSM